jgi:hypothetical protein
MKGPRVTLRTLDDLLQVYAKDYLTNNAPRTQYQQQRLFRRFSQDLGALPLESLTPQVLREYRDTLRQHLKPGTVRQYLDRIGIFIFCV